MFENWRGTHDIEPLIPNLVPTAAMSAALCVHDASVPFCIGARVGGARGQRTATPVHFYEPWGNVVQSQRTWYCRTRSRMLLLL